jgi:hypothetical protein
MKRAMHRRSFLKTVVKCTCPACRGSSDIEILYPALSVEASA